jgi:hypothetical protein
MIMKYNGCRASCEKASARVRKRRRRGGRDGREKGAVKTTGEELDTEMDLYWANNPLP